MNIAVLDVGSNSVKVEISKVEDGHFELIEDFKELLRLGDDVFRFGLVKDESIQRLINVIKEIKDVCDFKKVDKLRAVGTSALRDASNSREVIEKIYNETGVLIELISGEKEAELVYLAVTANFDINHSKTLIADIGGGSVEFIISDNNKVVFQQSTPYGCNRLLHKYFNNDPPKESEIEYFKNSMQNILSELPLDRSIDKVISLGGTLSNVSFVYMRQIHSTIQRIGYIDRKFLKSFIRNISSKTINQRKTIKGLDPKRADLVLPATLFIDTILDMCGKSGFYTMGGGLRIGVLIDTLNNMGILLNFQNSKENLRYLRLLEIGKKFQFEKVHAINVKNFAVQIFKVLKDKFNFSYDLQKYIEAASILHDIGNYISYSQHHKHSYYLIKNSDFIGYSNEEIELIANIARYHRKSLPKNSHENYVNLPENSKHIVRELASILRISDAIDRSHSGRIKFVDLNIQGNKLFLKMLPCDDISIEKKAIDRKKDLFEKTFNLELTVL